MRPTKSQGDCKHCKSTNKNIINEQMEQIVKQLKLPKDMLIQIEPELKKMLDKSKNVIVTQNEKLNTALQNIQKREDELKNSFIIGNIILDEFNKLNKILDERKVQIYGELNNLSYDLISIRNSIFTIFNLSDNLYDIFKSSEIDDKRKIVNLLFPNLFLDGQKLVFTLQKPFDNIIKMTSRPLWLPNNCTTRTFISKEAYDIEPKFVVDKMTEEHTEHSLHTAGIIVKFHKAVAMAA